MSQPTFYISDGI